MRLLLSLKLIPESDMTSNRTLSLETMADRYGFCDRIDSKHAFYINFSLLVRVKVVGLLVCPSEPALKITIKKTKNKTVPVNLVFIISPFYV